MNALKTIKNSFATAGIMTMSYAQYAFAQADFGGTPDIAGIPEASDPDDVRQTIISILAAILNFLALIAVIVVIIAGIRLIISQGEDEQKEKAKKTILYAIVGLVVVLFARVIVSLVTVYLAEQVDG